MTAIRLVSIRCLNTIPRDRAAQWMFIATRHLRDVERGNKPDDGLAEMARQQLLSLLDHPSPAIRKHARMRCYEHGVTKPVAVGFDMEGGAA